MSNQNTMESGHYEFTYQGQIDSTLHIFSKKTMSRSDYTAQETLDLLHFLQSHRSEIEEQVKLAQQPKPPKSLEQRIDDLFH